MKCTGSPDHYAKYTSPLGTVHEFWGPDCWQRAVAFKADLEAALQSATTSTPADRSTG
ncbi:hypothetical protein [Sagittula sp. S175]|uniref:hypothetical protein n=1 Tax=Sagittula sp. S175 TaxID=3415129 RepID=UPI003C7D80F1